MQILFGCTVSGIDKAHSEKGKMLRILGASV